MLIKSSLDFIRFLRFNTENILTGTDVLKDLLILLSGMVT